MPRVAVLAHEGKTLGGGLDSLRKELHEAGIEEFLWYEVPKSRKAPKKARKAMEEGAEILFVWGGDGMVQRCIDATAGSSIPIAILPAGTANLLATHLRIPKDVAACVQMGLHGPRTKMDLGRLNGERFAVMAGVGLDSLMIRETKPSLKRRLGRLAYLWAGAKELDDAHVNARIKVDGNHWFEGPVGCILAGNLGSIFGGVTLFEKADPHDGILDLGVVTADGLGEWARTLAKTVIGHPKSSPFVEFTQGRKMKIKLSHALPYEVDGSLRKPTKRLSFKVEEAGVTLCVPEPRATDR